MLLAPLPLLALAVAIQDPAPAPTLASLREDLAAAASLPTRAARARAAAKLAARKEVSLERWLAAARDPLVLERAAPGARLRTVALRVGNAEVETEMQVYVPPDYDPEHPAPLLFAAHGSGGRGAGLHHMWREVADALGMLVLAPTDPESAGGYRFTAAEREAALAALRWMRLHYAVDENRIHLTGISRGGHLVWDLALRHPDRFASLSPMIGGPWIGGGPNNVRYLENVAHLPIRDLQGERDDPGLLFNLRFAFERLAELGARDARLITFPDLGHSFRLEAVDWRAFFERSVRDPRPRRVVRLAARTDEARAFWVEIRRFRRGVAERFVPRVPAAKWNALDDAGKKRFFQREADRRTARLEVTMEEPGRFVARGEKVAAFRLLLDRAMLPAKGPVRVRFGARTYSRRPRPSARVLLSDFVERLDRSFLPLAEVRVPR